MKQNIVPPKVKPSKSEIALTLVVVVFIAIVLGVNLIKTIPNAPMSDRNEVPWTFLQMLMTLIVPLLIAFVILAVRFAVLSYYERKEVKYARKESR